MNLETIHTKLPFHCIRRQWGTHKLVDATQVSWSMQEVRWTLSVATTIACRGQQWLSTFSVQTVRVLRARTIW